MSRAHHSPPPDVLAAIAAAYRVLAAARAPARRLPSSRWRAAALLEIDDVTELRELERLPSRWRAAGRHDG